jgi:hypothetical protein
LYLREVRFKDCLSTVETCSMHAYFTSSVHVVSTSSNRIVADDLITLIVSLHDINAIVTVMNCKNFAVIGCPEFHLDSASQTFS